MWSEYQRIKKESSLSYDFCRLLMIFHGVSRETLLQIPSNDVETPILMMKLENMIKRASLADFALGSVKP